MSDSELLSDIRGELAEANSLLRIIATPLVAERLVSVLHKDEEWRVYKASDGRSREQVAEQAGVSHGTVSNYWKSWAPLGILEETDTKGRYRKRYNVDMFLLGDRIHGGNA